MKLVFALALIGYSALSQEVTNTKIMSFHKTHFGCIQTANRENYRGRRLHYNENYVCLQVKDSVIAAELKRREGSDRVIVHGSKRFRTIKPKRNKFIDRYRDGRR